MGDLSALLYETQKVATVEVVRQSHQLANTRVSTTLDSQVPQQGTDCNEGCRIHNIVSRDDVEGAGHGRVEVRLWTEARKQIYWEGQNRDIGACAKLAIESTDFPFSIYECLVFQFIAC